MSTLKTINIIHPTGTITNIVNDANGNVGIGTSTPALSSTTNRTYLTIKGQGSLFNDGIGVLQLATNTAGSIATNLGNIEWHIPDNSSSSSTRVGFIAGYATGSTANNRGGWIDFATKPDGVSGGGSVYMSVNSSQQIGISTGGYGGAIATNFRLEIVGMAGSNTGPAATGTTQDTSAVVRIRPGGGFTAALDIGSGGGTGAWIQSTDTANLATNYALLLNPNGGNVGIGTSSPSLTLNVKSPSDYRTALFETVSTLGPSVQIKGSRIYELRSTNTGASEGSGLFFIYDKTAEASRITVDSSGNVGIGTTSPSTYGKLAIQGTGSATIGLVTSTTAQYDGSYLNLYASGASANYGMTSLQHVLMSGSADLTNYYFQIQQRSTLNAYVATVYSVDYKNGNHAWYSPNTGTERVRFDNLGNVNIGGAADAGNGLRYLDVYSTNTGSSAGAIIRLITSNVAASGNTTVDIVKYKTGRFAINNNDTNAAAFTAFNVGGTDRMIIDSSGRVTKPSQPHIRVSAYSASNLTLAAGDNLVPFNTVQYQIGSNYNNTATNYKFTCPVAGVYIITAQVELSSSTATFTNLYIRVIFAPIFK